MTLAIMHEPLNDKLKLFESNHLLRKQRIIEDRFECSIKTAGKWVINFCNNDYLNLSTHQSVKKSFAKAAHHYGLGSGSSNLISGYYQSHHALEEALAQHLQRDRAILFNSGYHANLGVLQTFAQRNSVVIADKLCHASLIDGIVSSRAKHLRYAHHDYQHADRLLQQHEDQHCLLVTESVFSMEGDITDVKQLAAIAKKNKALLIVDDAHGFGTVGHDVGHFFNLTQQDIPVLVTPLAKGLGSLGAVVSGSDAVIENILQFARTYRYTISLPPAISTAALTALQVMQNEPWREQKLRQLSLFFNALCSELGLALTSKDPTPIKCILVGDNKKAITIQDILLQKGFLISGIRPPTVPAHTARLRITLNCLHTEEQVTTLLQHIQLLMNEESCL